ncbi:MAG: hypothetical protein QXI81_05420 [Nitrososphaerota archaeon]
MEGFQPSKMLQKYMSPITFLTCTSCGTENSRAFKEDDYVFKRTNEVCPKCGKNELLIVGIYVKEKEKKT